MTLAAWAFAWAAGMPAHADKFEPLCADLETERWDCWMPVELPLHQGCHVLISASERDFDSSVAWSGGCANGRAEGDGVLLDGQGNIARGRLVAGVKDGSWRTTLKNGSVISENYADGRIHGPATYEYASGAFIEGSYEKGWMHGSWRRLHSDGYTETGPYEMGKKHGTWAFTWEDDVEVRVTYVEDVVHGKGDGQPP